MAVLGPEELAALEKRVELSFAINRYVTHRAEVHEGIVSADKPKDGPRYGHVSNLFDADSEEKRLREHVITLARGVTKADAQKVVDEVAGFYPSEQPVHHRAMTYVAGEAVKIAGLWDMIREAHAKAPHRPVREPSMDDAIPLWG